MIGLTGRQSANMHRQNIPDALGDKALSLRLLDPVESAKVKDCTGHCLTIRGGGNPALFISRTCLSDWNGPFVWQCRRRCFLRTNL